MKCPFSLEGKNIFVTGATSGIGKATAILCSDMGAHVVITGRNQVRLSETSNNLLQNGTHTAVIADLTDSASMLDLIGVLPKLDGVVLCAGINTTLPIQFLTRKKLDSIFEVNFFSQVELMRQLLKKKLLSDGASVVAVSSIGGNNVYSPGASAYGASKAALLSWMRTAAKELAPRIRVNCICPGQVNTPMNQDGSITPEQYEAYSQTIPMKRFGEPEEVAAGAVYLLSDCARWVTGSSLVIDGGSSL